MKKIFFSAFAVMAVGSAVMGGYVAYNAKNQDASNPLLLENIEAVSQGAEDPLSNGKVWAGYCYEGEYTKNICNSGSSWCEESPAR